MLRGRSHLYGVVWIGACALWLVGCASSSKQTRRPAPRAMSPEPAAPQARAAAFKHAATGIAFPKELAGLRFSGHTDFEPRMPGMGVSVRYLGRRVRADLYVYNYRLKGIPNGIQHRTVRFAYMRAVKEIGIMAQRGYYRRLRRITQRRIKLGGGKGLWALYSAYSFVTRGGYRFSVLCLTGFNGHFVKLRLTYPQAIHRSYGRKVVKQIFQELGDLLQ